MTQFWLEGTPIKVWAEAGIPKRLVWNETVYPVAEILNHWRIDLGWWRLRLCRDYFKLQTSPGRCWKFPQRDRRQVVASTAQ